jgi:branched-chain amino acid aminotransferase
MSHVVWLDGALVDPATAALPITDPGVRWGDGLFETMRAEGGQVAMLDRHLARLSASITALALAPIPTGDEIRAGVAAVVAQLDETPHRVRITVTTRPTLLVEATPYEPGDPDTGVTVVALPNTWWPHDEIREHKTLSYAEHRLAHRRAVAAGADHALLIDDRGHLGESDAANVFVVTGETLVTSPIEGILGGVTRDLLLQIAADEGIAVEVRHITEPEWRGADEMLLSNGLAGVTPVVAIDGVPVGGGRPGPMSARLRAAFARTGAA